MLEPCCNELALVPSVEWFEGGVSRLLTLESAFTGERAGNLEVAFKCPKLVGGGSSNTGRLEAAGRRAVRGCGAVFSASSAVPIPGGGIARAARLPDCRGSTWALRRYSESMNDGATVRLAGGTVAAEASRLTMGVSKDQNRPPKEPDESSWDGYRREESLYRATTRLCRNVRLRSYTRTRAGRFNRTVGPGDCQKKRAPNGMVS